MAVQLKFYNGIYFEESTMYLELQTGVYVLRAIHGNGVVTYTKFVATPHGK